MAGVDRRLPDESFTSAGLRGLLFFVRQPVIWVPTVLFTLGFGGWLLWLSHANGRLNAQSFATLALIAPVCGFGFTALTALPGFLAYRFFTQDKPRFSPDDGEELLEDVAANHLRDGEGRGGRLYVTDRRVVFLPHRLNFQLDRVELARDAIEDVGWRRVLRGQLVMSHELELETAAGRERFVAHRAPELADLIADGS